ncbi:retrovirus-related Pol polyprotein from transposon TNT 1-94 [Trichonephila clavipes]|nr:retrovirus-related Pol polyprotein from transposon TNT 1-94 [Trichonephila clavipes]
MKIGNNGNLALDESTPCLMIVLMNCQTKLRINHLIAVKSVSILEKDKPEDLTRKDEMDWITKNSDAIAYIKLSLADEQALQFAAEDNAKVLWDKIRATYMGEAKDCYYRNKNSPSTRSQRNNSSRNRHVFTASHREEKPCDNIWILDSGASCHMAKEPVWFKKNISPEVMNIYLADKNSKMMSQGTGNVSAKTKCEVFDIFSQFKAKYENLTDKRIKKIRTDNGLEFVNGQLDTYLANSGIFHEKTIPYNSESNGKAERPNRVLLERARFLLYESKLLLKFWAEVINCSTQVSNITPRKGKAKIPLEIWTGRRGIMLGYARERRGYRIYDIKNQKVIEERSVKFNEYLNGSNYLGEIENETWDIDSFFEVSPERNEINQNTENGVLYNFDINNGPGAIENDNSIPLQTTSSPRTGRIQILVLELNDVQNQIPVRRSERLKI